MYSKFGQFIDGKWTASQDNSTYEVINPATEEVLGHASKATPADIERALKSSEQGLQVWKKITPWQRAYILRKIADKIRETKDILAKWMTLENGKPLAEGIGETNGAADIFVTEMLPSEYERLKSVTTFETGISTHIMLKMAITTNLQEILFN